MSNFPQQRELPLCLKADKCGADWCQPLDLRDLATRLEAEGVTDAVAASQFGFASTWSMAESWFPKVQAFAPAPEASGPPRRIWREYWNGISFALPLLCSCVAMALLDFSLWGGELSTEEATAVGLGIVASFLLGGGFVQVMARRGLFFAGTKQFHRCEQSTWWWVRTSALASLLATFIAVAAASYWDWLPFRLTLIAAGFCVALGLFWLATGILHFLQRGLLVTWVTLGGIALVALFHLGAGWPLLGSQFAAIVGSGGAAFLIAARLLRRDREVSRVTAFPPVVPQDLLRLWPYFAYGVFYYVLLFADRLVAWTAYTHASPLAVQFRGDYETALNLGLLAFVFQVGWVHHSMVAFYREVVRLQKRFAIDRTGKFRQSMLVFYRSRIRWLVPLAAASTALVLVIAAAAGFLASGAIGRTSFWALAGFPFLVAGLWNVSLLFALASAPRAAAAAGVACLVDIAAGYLLSRLGSYHLAVVGFTLGAVVFAVLSGIWCYRAFQRLDYLYFAASS